MTNKNKKMDSIYESTILPPRTPTTEGSTVKSHLTVSTTPATVAATPSPLASTTTTTSRRGTTGMNNRPVMGPPLPPNRILSTPTSTTMTPSVISNSDRSNSETLGPVVVGTAAAAITNEDSSISSSIYDETTAAAAATTTNTSTTTTRSRVGRVLKRLRKPLRNSIRRRRSSKASDDALSSSFGSSLGSFSEVESSSSLASGLEGSLTINSTTSFGRDEEEGGDDPHLDLNNNNNRQQQQQHRSGSKITGRGSSDVSNRNNRNRTNRSIVVHESSSTPSSTTAGVSMATTIYQRQDASFTQWVSSVHALAGSRELHQFVHASGHLLLSTAQTTTGIALGVTGTVVKTASLPVTVPLYVTAAATDHVINIAGAVIGGIVHHTIGNGKQKGISEEDTEASTEDGNSSTEEKHHTPTQDLLHNVLNFVPFVVDTVVKTAMHSVQTPYLPKPNDKMIMSQNDQTPVRTNRPQQPQPELKVASTQTSSHCQPSSCTDSNSTEFLDRLRLDFSPMEQVDEESNAFGDDTISARTTSSCGSKGGPAVGGPSDVSKSLLRVDDVTVMAPPNPASDKELRVMFVDVGEEFEDENLTRTALSQLILRGIDIVSSNAAVKVEFGSKGIMPQGDFPIEWKPQGQTKKECKRLAQMPQSAVFESLSKQVLIWSGSYRGPTYHGSDQTVFMARGIVKGSPREFMNLMWDSSRTGEYNNYCLGRRDVRVIQDDILSGGSFGAKVIKSETSIPFTSLSVSLTALMHARAIGDNPNDGFIIFSRSLNVGRAGYHRTTKHVDDLRSSKNEIILGVNYMRPVPGHPHLTDLISVSQVNASMLPPFLAFRIGMMGVEDFFKNVR